VRRDQLHATATYSERGFVIVAVLWILMALSALAVIFSLYLSGSARALSVSDTALQAEALVSASLELTTYQLLLQDDDTRPSQGSFHFRMDDADVVVAFKSETARIDLNYAPKDLLANLFAGLGANQAAAQEDADRIIGWRTRPAPNAVNDEEALYGAAGLDYSPRQSLFTHVNELALVVGLTPALVDRALPFVTVFNGSSDVDPQIAAPEVIAALPKAPASGTGVTSSPPSNGGLPSANQPAPAQGDTTIPKSASYRIETTIKFNDGRRTASEVVIALGDKDGKDNNKDGKDKDDPYRVLSWQDDVEPRAAPRKRIGPSWR
jgi:general secretion pathway protein K